jgi:hypothetical protein
MSEVTDEMVAAAEMVHRLEGTTREALEAALDAAWRDIDTAREDEKEIVGKKIFLTDGESVEVGYWYMGAWQCGIIPTRWMPLPAPPKEP